MTEPPAALPPPPPDPSLPVPASPQHGFDRATAPPTGITLDPRLERALADRRSSEIALMDLVTRLGSVSAARAMVHRAIGALPHEAPARAARLDAFQALIAGLKPGYANIVDRLATGAAAAPPATAEDRLAHTARLFDWGVAQNEAASVALYSHGDEAVLARATAEVVDLLARWRLLQRGRGGGVRVLQIGCGIGRIEQALAPHVQMAIGTDLAAAMVDHARRRTAACDNVHFVRTSGRDLAPFRDASVDLLLAIDSLPYIVDAGEPLVERHFHEARRVLAAEGAFVIANYSYRASPTLDRRDVAALAARAGLTVEVDADSPFALWDALVWLLRPTSR